MVISIISGKLPVQQRSTARRVGLALAAVGRLMIGVVLIAEGLHQHIPRGYIYSAMGFSLVVEMLNLKMGRRRQTASLEGG